MDLDMTRINVSHWPGRMIWTEDGPIATDPDLELNDDAIAFMRNLPGVHVVSPIMTGHVFIRSGPYVWQGWQVQGLSAEALPLMGFDVLEGRLIEPGDHEEGFAALFGYAAEGGFMRPDGPWENRIWDIMMGMDDVATRVDIFNDPIRISYDSRFTWVADGEVDIEEALRPVRSFELNVVGRLASDMRGNNDGSIIMDIDVLQELLMEVARTDRINREEQGFFSGLADVERQTYNDVMVRVSHIDYAVEVAEAIRAMGFDVWYNAEWILGMQDSQQAQMILLGSIGGVSLFVAAIGIANTMIMAVYERTREIGVMKVIGAAIWDIKRLFLLESVLIGFLGGMLGIALSYGIAHILNNTDAMAGMMGGGMGMGGVEHQVSLITPWLVGMAMAFASSVGLVSGYFPARRATKLSALAAIRND